MQVAPPPSTPLPWDNGAHIGRGHATHVQLHQPACEMSLGLFFQASLRLPHCAFHPGATPGGRVSAHPGPGPCTLLVSPKARYSKCVPCLDTHPVCPQAHPGLTQCTAETHACIVSLLSGSWLAYSYLNGLVPLRFISFLSSDFHCNGYTALHNNQQ